MKMKLKDFIERIKSKDYQHSHTGFLVLSVSKGKLMKKRFCLPCLLHQLWLCDEEGSPLKRYDFQPQQNGVLCDSTKIRKNMELIYIYKRIHAEYCQGPLIPLVSDINQFKYTPLP